MSAPLVEVMIPTLNEAGHIAEAVANARRVGPVFVLDSHSTDGTQELARQAGATVVEHDFIGYGPQKNWGLDHLPFQGSWVFILDADERFTPALADEIRRVAEHPDGHEGYYVNRLMVFMGQPIRHGGLYPSWNLRFFRRGACSYEQRLVHEHMVCRGPTARLRRQLIHIRDEDMTSYIAKHIRYADLESDEWVRRRLGPHQPEDSGSVRHDRAWYQRGLRRRIWPRLPLRPVFRFFYMYLFRLGCLDGRAGWHLALLMGNYEYMISVLYKDKRHAAGAAIAPGFPAAPAPGQASPARPLGAAPGAPAPGAIAGSVPAEPAQPVQPTPVFQRLDRCAQWPYPPDWYLRRLAWEWIDRLLLRWSYRRASSWRVFWLRVFGAKIGPHCTIRPGVRVVHPWLLTMGSWSCVGDDAVIYNLGPVAIGDHSMISQHVYVCAGTHDYTQPDLPLQRPPIVIGSGVWVCAHAFIGPNITIGDNAVVGARAVVVKSVPPGMIVGGNPAKVLKARPMPARPADPR